MIILLVLVLVVFLRRYIENYSPWKFLTITINIKNCLSQMFLLIFQTIIMIKF